MRNRWARLAYSLLETRYPVPPHEIRFETPRVQVNGDGGGEIIADLGVYLADSVVAIVEVGDLSRPDKLFLWEHTFPGIAVYWIHKADLLPYVDDKFARFQWHRAGTAPSDVERMVFRVSRQTDELLAMMQKVNDLHRKVGQVAKAIRRAAEQFSRDLVSTCEWFDYWANGTVVPEVVSRVEEDITETARALRESSLDEIVARMEEPERASDALFPPAQNGQEGMKT